MEFRIFLISVFLVLFNLSEGNTVSKTIPTSKVAQNCPVYTVNTQSCINKGGVFTFTTNAVGCKAPTCIYPQATTSSKVIPSSSKVITTTTSTSSKAIPSSSKVITTTTTSSSKAIPTSTKRISQQNCPIYTINTQSCVNKGGVITFTTNAVGCKAPTCVTAQATTSSKVIPSSSKVIITTTTVSSKIIPSSSKVITTTTSTSSKAIPTSTKRISQQNCPIYSINTQSCVNKGGVITFTTDAVGCKAPTCVTAQATTSSKVVPSSSKVIITTTTTSSKVIPSSSKVITTTTSTSSKAIPTSTKSINPQNCPIYTVNTQSCVNKGGAFTFTTNAIGCKSPTCVYPQTTTTSKVIPTSTKTITFTKSPNDCEAVTVTKKEKVTVTVKETVTVTAGSGSAPTSGASEKCAKKWQQCGGAGFSGPTCCESGSSCHQYDKYYSQCI